MLLIIAHHYTVHSQGLLWNPTGDGTFAIIFGMFGLASNDIFVLITGYFSITAKISYRRVLGILTAMNFYYWALMAFYFIRGETDPFYINYKNLMPVFWGNGFVVGYIWFSLLIPFLNKLLLGLSKQKFTLLVAAICLGRIVLAIFDKNWEGTTFETFPIMYIFGAYIRLHIPQKRKFQWLWYLPCLFYAGIWLLNIPAFCLDLGMTPGAQLLLMIVTPMEIMSANLYWQNVLVAVSVLMLFRNWKFYSPAINRMATCVLGIYLIHENNILRGKIWNAVLPASEWLGTKWLLPHALLKVMAVFGICMLAEAVRIAIFKKTVDPLLDRWWAHSRLKHLLESEP